MKKIFTLLAVFFFLNIATSISQNYIEIGSGTVDDCTMPLNAKYWKNAWTSMIFNASELEGAKTITKIAIYSTIDFSQWSYEYTFENQKIYMNHTSDDVWADTYIYEYPESNDYTLVYDGELPYLYQWLEIDITDFDYNGTDNLVIHWENRNNETLTSGLFMGTEVTDEVIKTKGNDIGLSEEAGALPDPLVRPNIRIYYESGDAPATPLNPAPANATELNSIFSELTFDLGTNTTKYDLYLGTAEDNMTKVANDVAATEGSYTYTPATELSSLTNYYWQVIAKNETSQTEGPVWQFKTEQLVKSFPFTEGFENSTALVLVENWYNHDNQWGRSGGDLNPNNPHQGEWCASIGSHSSPAILMTPKIRLTQNNVIKFWWADADAISGSKIQGYDTTFFEISIDDQKSWITLDTLTTEEQMTEYVEIVKNLSTYNGKDAHFRWRDETVGWVFESRGALLDDIEISGSNAPGVMFIETDSLNFGNIALNGTASFDLQIANYGTSTLQIDSVTVSAPFYCSFTGTLQPQQVSATTIEFNPTEEGSFMETLKYHISGTYSGPDTVVVLGTAVSGLDYFYESFDTDSGLEWTKITSATDEFTDITIIESSWEAYSPPNCVKMIALNDSISPLMLITPGLTAFDKNKLKFYAYKYDDRDLDLIVGLMGDRNNPETFVPIDSIALEDEYQQYTIEFPADNILPFVGFKHGGNHTYSSLRLDDVEWGPDTLSVPNPAEAVYPLHQATDIDFDPVLDWTSGGGNPIGYMLSFGSDNPPTNMMDSIDLEDATSWEVNRKLTWGTTYYWQVIPYNDQGIAEECPVWSFTIMEDPTITEFPYNQDFDQVEQNSGTSLPLGWRSQTAVSYNFWDLAQSATLARSPLNCMWILFTFPGTDQDAWIYTPPVRMEAGNAYDVGIWYSTMVDPALGEIFDERMEIRYGISPYDTSMMTTPIYDNDYITNIEYEQAIGTIQPEEDGDYYIGIHAYSLPNKGALMVDDFSIEIGAATVPGVASIEYPADEETNVALNPTLQWSKGEGSVTDYKLNLGTDNPPTNLFSAESLGNIEEYEITDALEANTTYYWQIIPSNSVGDAIDCPVWSFTTGDGTSIDEMLDAEISIYPNPSNGTFIINYGKIEVKEIRIYDICGKLFFQRGVIERGAISIADCEKGVYMVKILTKVGEVTKRVVVK